MSSKPSKQDIEDVEALQGSTADLAFGSGLGTVGTCSQDFSNPQISQSGTPFFALFYFGCCQDRLTTTHYANSLSWNACRFLTSCSFLVELLVLLDVCLFQEPSRFCYSPVNYGEFFRQKKTMTAQNALSIANGRIGLGNGSFGVSSARRRRPSRNTNRRLSFNTFKEKR